jgi:sarcosine oxidase delta subunit
MEGGCLELWTYVSSCRRHFPAVKSTLWYGVVMGLHWAGTDRGVLNHARPTERRYEPDVI